MEIKKISLIKPVFNILVLRNGKANYNIIKKSENNNKKDRSFDLKLKKVNIKNLDLNYNDNSNGLTIKIKNFTHKGNGNFTKNNYLYNLNGQAETLDVIFDKIHYLNKVKTDISTKINIQNNFKTYIIDKLQLKLNDLDLLSKMRFDLNNDDIKIDISYETKDNNIKKLLSLIPKKYLPDFNNIKTNGIAQLQGYVKGIYNKNNIPAYNVKLNIKNGTIGYPDLAEKLKNVNIFTDINFKGGKNIDNTTINIPTIHFSVADNNMNGNLKINNPVSDPLINANLKGNLNLNKFLKTLKLSTNGINKLKGLLETDFKLKTRMSAVEKQKYQNIEASGNFKLYNFSIYADSILYPINISVADIKLTPSDLQINKLQSTIGTSDFSVNGKLKNYLSYFLKKTDTLKANFNLNSNKINLNEFMTNNQTKTNDTSAYIKIPKKIDIKFIGKANEVIYKDMKLNKVVGNVRIKKQKAIINTALSKTFGGDFGFSGTYDTSKEKPFSNIKINMKQVSITEASTSLTTFNYYTPFMKKIQGQFFSNMQMQMELDKQMKPIFSTLNLSGMLETQNIKLYGMNILKKIGGLLNINELNKTKIDKVKASFDIDKGNVNVKPFEFKLNGMKSKMSGKISLDKNLDFLLKIDIPKTKLGNNANKILEDLLGKLSKLGLDTKLPDIIKMKFRIKGNYNNPKIIPIFNGYEGNSVQETVTQVVNDKINQAKSKAIAEAQAKADELMKTAQQQADKLVAEAKNQRKKLIEESKKIGNKLRTEAKKQADKLIKQAGNNLLKKMAAQTAANQIIKQSDKKANQLENQAVMKGNQLVTIAQNKANLILKNAKEKSNKLIKEAKNK